MQEVLIGHVNTHMQQLTASFEKQQIARAVLTWSDPLTLVSLRLGGTRQLEGKAFKEGLLNKGGAIDAATVLPPQPIGNPAPLPVMGQQFTGNRIGCLQLYLRRRPAIMAAATNQHQ